MSFERVDRFVEALSDLSPRRLDLPLRRYAEPQDPASATSPATAGGITGVPGAARVSRSRRPAAPKLCPNIGERVRRPENPDGAKRMETEKIAIPGDDDVRGRSQPGR